MIQALKGAFMGHIGLLLNAPYKIDSMMWMRLVISFCMFFAYGILAYFGL
jgi:hypothetical protein